MIKSWELPIRIYSEMNMNDHWRVRNKRKHWQQFLIHSWWVTKKPVYFLPLKIILTRLSPRRLDDDNLVSGFKFVRDAIANKIFPNLQAGRADDSPQLSWQYEQSSAKSYGIRITFEFTEKMPVAKT